MKLNDINTYVYFSKFQVSSITFQQWNCNVYTWIKFDTRKATQANDQTSDQTLIIKTSSLKLENAYVKDAFAEKNAETYLKVGRQHFADLNLHISLCRSAFRSALPNADLSFKDWASVNRWVAGSIPAMHRAAVVF